MIAPNTTTVQTAIEVTLQHAVDTFLDIELMACSSQTTTWYRARLRLFVTAIGPDKPLADITEKDLITWWKSLKKRTDAEPPELSIDTMHGYVRSVRRLFKWLYERKLTITELWRVLKLPKIPDQLRKGIDDNKVTQLLGAAANSPRDLAIMLFIESSGCRRGGVASLKLSDLNLSQPEPICRQASVIEKGSKIRPVVLSQEAVEALRAWLLVRKSKTDYVFVDERPGHDRGLKPGAISQIVARYKKAQGITGRCSPHQWRHRFCRTLIKNGMPLNIVSQLAGHKNVIVTAKYYGNLLVDELQNSYDRYYKPPK